MWKYDSLGGLAMIVRTILKSKSSNDVATAAPDQTIAEAAKALHQHRIGALVVTGVAHKIVGILSERDIVRGIAAHGENCLTLRIRDLMTSDVLVCNPDDSVETLEQMMTTNRIRHLPVVESGKLVGIITIGDVVKSRLDDTTMQMDSLRDYVMAAR